MPNLLHVSHGPFYPDTVGGAQLSTLYLLNALKARGWGITVVCGPKSHYPFFPVSRNYSARDRLRLVKCYSKRCLGMLSPGFERDEAMPFETWRGWNHGAKLRKFYDGILRRNGIDYVLGQDYGSRLEFQFDIMEYFAARLPTMLFFRSSTLLAHPELPLPRGVRAISNSDFQAENLISRGFKDVPVVSPFIEFSLVRSEKRQREYITFINPTKEKGVEVFLEVASRLPQYKFLVVRGKWTNQDYSMENSWIRKINQLPHVLIEDFREDMREVYAKTDILLMPSQFEETFGRVILEAHVNGIPVVGSNSGSIPAVSDKGGLIVKPRNDASGYIAALTRLKSDKGLYQELSAAAIRNAAQPKYDPVFLVDQFVNFCAKELGK